MLKLPRLQFLFQQRCIGPCRLSTAFQFLNNPIVLTSLKRIPPAGIAAMPILWGSTVMDFTPSKLKSKLGLASDKNGITKPPNAASTCKKTLCFSAILKAYRWGLLLPNSAVPAVPTMAIVFLLMSFSTSEGQP